MCTGAKKKKSEKNDQKKKVFVYHNTICADVYTNEWMAEKRERGKCPTIYTFWYIWYIFFCSQIQQREYIEKKCMPQWNNSGDMDSELKLYRFFGWKLPNLFKVDFNRSIVYCIQIERTLFGFIVQINRLNSTPSLFLLLFPNANHRNGGIIFYVHIQNPTISSSNRNIYIHSIEILKSHAIYFRWFNLICCVFLHSNVWTISSIFHSTNETIKVITYL